MMRSRPYLSISACNRLSPVRQDAICANTSPCVVSGTRTLPRVNSITSSSSSPSRTRCRGGIYRASPYVDGASAWKLPGTGPPASDQCAEFWTKATSSPSEDGHDRAHVLAVGTTEKRVVHDEDVALVD